MLLLLGLRGLEGSTLRRGLRSVLDIRAPRGAGRVRGARGRLEWVARCI